MLCSGLDSCTSDTEAHSPVCEGRAGNFGPPCVPVSEKYFLGNPGKLLIDKYYTCETCHPVLAVFTCSYGINGTCFFQIHFGYG